MTERNSIIDAQEEQQFWEDAKAAQNAAPLPTDPEWEAYSKMMEEEENADQELSTKPPRPKHCPIPKDDIKGC